MYFVTNMVDYRPRNSGAALEWEGAVKWIKLHDWHREYQRLLKLRERKWSLENNFGNANGRYKNENTNDRYKIGNANDCLLVGISNNIIR